ncbi:MAG: hypothetical protein ACPF9Q_06205, partial [Opitutales bacterium]
KWSHAKKIALIKGDFESLKRLSKFREKHAKRERDEGESAARVRRNERSEQDGTPQVVAKR